jgi:multidrug transporter EmrE-like cation transporter
MVKTKKPDILDRFIQSIDWKWGNFSMLPIIFGTVMAILDLVMMGSVKMIHGGTLSASVGIPISVGIYALEPVLFLKAMNYEGMAVMNLIWNLMSDVLVTLQAVLIFGETIKGIRWVAVGMAIVSLCIFAYTDE